MIDFNIIRPVLKSKAERIVAFERASVYMDQWAKSPAFSLVEFFGPEHEVVCIEDYDRTVQLRLAPRHSSPHPNRLSRDSETCRAVTAPITIWASREDRQFVQVAFKTKSRRISA